MAEINQKRKMRVIAVTKRTHFIITFVVLAIAILQVLLLAGIIGPGLIKKDVTAVEPDTPLIHAPVQSSLPVEENSYYQDHIIVDPATNRDAEITGICGPPSGSVPLHALTHDNGVMGNGMLFASYHQELLPESKTVIQAFDLYSKQPKWSYEISPSFRGHVGALSETTVYVISENVDTSIYALDQKSGEMSWLAYVPGHIADFVIAPGYDHIYVAATNGVISTIGLADGKTSTLCHRAGEKISKLVLTGDYLFVEADEYYLYSIPQGKLVWERPKKRHSYSNTAIYGNRLLITDETGLTCTSFLKGAEGWQTVLSPERGTYPIAVGREQVYTGLKGGKLMAFGIETGQQTWEKIIPEADEFDALAVFGDSLFAIASTKGSRLREDSKLFAIDLKTDKIYWQLEGCETIPSVYADLGLFNFYDHRNICIGIFGPGTIEKSARLDSLQEHFEYIELAFYRGTQYWPELGKIIETVLDKYQDAKVFRAGNWEDEPGYFKVAPVLLEFLGKIYRHQGQTEKAMRCFQRMVNEYGKEKYFIGDSDRAQVIFLAGGEGLSLQVETLRDYVKDYEAAIAAAHAMAAGEYGQEVRFDWAPPEYEPYAMIALAHLRLTLEAMEAPLSRWEAEYTKLYNGMSDKDWAALVVQELAGIMQKNGKIEQAIALYNLLRTEYSEAFVSLGEGFFENPAYSACQSLIGIYTEQNRPAAEIDVIKKDMEKIDAFMSTATEGWWDPDQMY